MRDSRLIIPPYVGEFGWELMNWQGRVRRVVECWMAERAGPACATVVFSSGRRALYADLPDATNGRSVLVEATLDEVPGEPNDDHRVDLNGAPIDAVVLGNAVLSAMRRVGVAPTDADTVHWPDYRGRLYSADAREQRFAELTQPGPIESDVLLVPRERRLASERSRSANWWTDLAAALAHRGLRVATYRPPLENALMQLATTRLAVGGSTGGLHLASLARCPHYVWGPGDEERWTAIGMSNRQRYETIWNPLGTPVRYDALGWQPEIGEVVHGVCRALDEIGRGRAATTTAIAERIRWSARRGLARLWTCEPSAGRTPWRIRELVRTRLT